MKFCPSCGVTLRGQHSDQKNHMKCCSCGDLFYSGPKLVVLAVLFEKQKLLLVRRNLDPGKGSWAIPGGYVEQGEVVERAVHREILEEVGLSVIPKTLLGVYSEEGNDVCLLVYVVERDSGVLSIDIDEIQAAEFFSLDNLPPLVFPMDTVIINDWLKWFQN